MEIRTENNIPIGNIENKLHSKNPISKYLVHQFHNTIEKIIKKIEPEIQSVNEIGCGEGYLTSFYASFLNCEIKACDFSKQIIDIAKQREPNLNFYVKSIYDLKPSIDSADLIVCCEVLEHIDNPEKGIEKLIEITNKYLLVSVPNEPLWRILNMIRGKYLKSFGNTPGHINHWNSFHFNKLFRNKIHHIKQYLPVPWTVLLITK